MEEKKSKKGEISAFNKRIQKELQGKEREQ